MNTSKFRFTLDLHRTQSQISVPVTLGDTARTWLISFSDGSLPYLLGNDRLAKLEIKRPTGTHIEEFCAIEDGMSVRYSFSQNENTAAVEGIHECAIVLYDAEGTRLASPRFTMIVSARIINADDINLSDDDKSAVESMISAEAARHAAELGRINAEAERQTAEYAREQAEQTRSESMKILQESGFLENPLPAVGDGDDGKFVGVRDGRYILLNLSSDDYGGNMSVENSDGTMLLAFTIAGKIYRAEQGMTWGAWIDSEYNTDGYQRHPLIGNEYFSAVHKDFMTVIRDHEWVDTTQEILDGFPYASVYMVQ